MNEPFDHWIIDDFLNKDLASQLANEFPNYESPNWLTYNNPLEHKKSLNSWYYFPPTTYQFFAYLNSVDFIHYISSITGIEGLFPDIGLHGAGWHIHGRDGKLNVHFDYSIHPKLKLLRKLNLILYLTEDWDTSWGGGLQLWSHNSETNQPKDLITTVDFKFNRALIFDTTQNSWHGFPDPLTCPDNIYRKSIAMYYLIQPPEGVDTRERALYSPSEKQKGDPEIERFIKERSK